MIFIIKHIENGLFIDGNNNWSIHQILSLNTKKKKKPSFIFFFPGNIHCHFNKLLLLLLLLT